MKKYYYLVICLILILSLTGCTTTPKAKEFLGISMNSVRDAKDFVIYSTEEGVKYKKSLGMDDRIFAGANIGRNYLLRPTLDIGIINKSNRPIAINYFTDRFFLTTKNGNIYELEQEKDPMFVYSKNLNPGDGINLHPLLPNVIKDLKKEDVALIVCEIGSLTDRVTIVLKPLPEIKNTQPEPIKKNISSIRKCNA